MLTIRGPHIAGRPPCSLNLPCPPAERCGSVDTSSGTGPRAGAGSGCRRRIAGQVRVLDHVARMLLVEASSSQVARLVAALPRWIATEERTFSVGERTDGELG